MGAGIVNAFRAARVALVLLLTGALAACQTGDDAPPEGPAPATGAALGPADRGALTEGGVLRWGINEFPAQWNPHHPDGNLATVETVTSALLPRPFRLDENGAAHPDPDYVRDVEVREPGKDSAPQVVTLRLNPDAHWSDDTPITWRDYRAMAEALSGERKGYRILGDPGYERIASVRPGENRFEVVITFETAFADYASLFTPLLPAEYTREPERFNTGYLGDIPVTAGPFEFAGIDRTQRTLTVRRSDQWWGEPALLDRIVFRAMAPEALGSAFLDGGVDVYALPVGAGEYERAASAPGREVRAALAPDYRQITLNGQSGALSDVDVRHAVFLGIDRRALARAAFSGIGWQPKVLDNHFLMTNQDGYADNSGAWGAHDPERARKLLERAGWTASGDGPRTRDGETLTLRFTVPRGHRPALDEAELVQSMLGEIGIRVRIEQVAGDELFPDYVVPGNYDMVAFVLTGDGFTAAEGLRRWGRPVTRENGRKDWRANVGRIASPEIDAAMSDALASLDEDAAIRHVNRADRLLWAAGHTLPLYQRPELVAVRSDLANIGSPGLGTLDYADIGHTRGD